MSCCETRSNPGLSEWWRKYGLKGSSMTDFPDYEEFPDWEEEDDFDAAGAIVTEKASRTEGWRRRRTGMRKTTIKGGKR